MLDFPSVIVLGGGVVGLLAIAYLRQHLHWTGELPGASRPHFPRWQPWRLGSDPGPLLDQSHCDEERTWLGRAVYRPCGRCDWVDVRAWSENSQRSPWELIGWRHSLDELKTRIFHPSWITHQTVPLDD